jgi:hypothetical protein
MLAEMMKTFPSTGSLNVTEFFHNEDNNRIFNDLIMDLKKLGKYLKFYTQFNQKTSLKYLLFMFLQ